MPEFEELIPEGYCLSCRGCCRFAEKDSVWLPHLLGEEKKQLAEISVLPDPRQENYFCVFLDTKTNKCQVYAKRPFDCRLYPFLINRLNGGVFLGIDPNCVFVKDNLGKKGFRESLLKIGRSCQSEGFRNILKGNPCLIQAYEGILHLVRIDI
jgi:Fe-S-cluster containining protein